MLLGAAMAMATVEVNACMGRIVAAPTAGASGILPGVLLAAQQTHGYEDDELIMALFCASAIGALIATNASISGAQGGCQARRARPLRWLLLRWWNWQRERRRSA